MNKVMTVCREVQKEDKPPARYRLGSSTYPHNLMSLYQRCYTQDKMMYDTYVREHPDVNHDAWVGSWMYCFTIGLVTVTGYLRNFDAAVFPEWDADRIYDPDDDMERRVRSNDD